MEGFKLTSNQNNSFKIFEMVRKIHIEFIMLVLILYRIIMIKKGIQSIIRHIFEDFFLFKQKNVN